jgi:hypothetical protein
MGERGGLLGLFLSFILFFSIPASWRANEMGVPALPCPFPLFPLISSCFGFCCKKKSQNPEDSHQMCEGPLAVRLHCIAKN